MLRRRRRHFRRAAMRLAMLVALVSGVAWALGELVDDQRAGASLIAVHSAVSPPPPRFGAIAPEAIWKFEIDRTGLTRPAVPAPPPTIAMILQDDGSVIEPGHGNGNGLSPFGLPATNGIGIAGGDATTADETLVWHASAAHEIGPPGVDGLIKDRIAAAPPALPPRAAVNPGEPVIAVVIDDLGHNPAHARRVMDLPQPTTMAFLPYPDPTPSLARDAVREGHEVILHMPMEPLGDADPGPGALLVELPASELVDRVNRALDRVPGAVGVNNHMGSRFTNDAAAMGVVLEQLKEHGLFFVDSVTAPETAIREAASTLALPTAARDVFIDHVPTRRSIDAQLARAERMARQTGSVIAIGHPGEHTLAALETWMPQAAGRGLRFVPVSDIVARRLCARSVEGCGNPEQYLAQVLSNLKGPQRETVR